MPAGTPAQARLQARLDETGEFFVMADTPTVMETASIKGMDDGIWEPVLPVKHKAGTKATKPDPIKQTVQARVEAKAQDAFPLSWWFSSSAEDEIAPWWSPRRDADLRAFWMKEGNDILAGAVSSMVKKFKAMSWEIEGPESVVKHFQEVLSGAEFGQGWGTFIAKLLTDLLCLAGRTRVRLGGSRRGKTKTIARIVKDKDPGPVLSIDKDGKVVERRIIDWQTTPLGDRRWWWLSLENASGHSQDKKGGIFLTEDHPVLTADGWLQARDVKVGMKVATGDPKPSVQQMEILVGGLLGDMSVGNIRKRAMLRFSHAVDQEEWLQFKLDALSGFDWTGRKAYASKAGSHFIGVNSRGSIGLTSLRNRWYPNGTKIVCREDVVQYLTARSMAVWFCDDGTLHHNFTRNGNETSPHASLYANSFSVEDVEWLVEWLHSMGLECKLATSSGYPTIRFSCEGTRQLSKLIGQYVPPFMRYKLPNNAPAYNSENWDIAQATVYYDDVVASEPRDYSSGYRTVQTTYHLGVEETRNFIAANVVVHNTQDKGCFFEVIGEGKPDKPLESRAIGVANLDASLCQLTGDPTYPVLYWNVKDGLPHKLHATRVVHIVDMPSPNEVMLNVGYCSVSRVIASSQILLMLSQYKKEKLSDLPPAGLLTLSNVMPRQWEDQKAEYKRERRRLGQDLWANVMTLFSLDPAQPATASLTSFSSLPDSFDEQTATNLYVNIVALAFGVDVREFWPMSAGALGTASETLVMHQKAKGKGVGEVISSIERAVNWAVLPKTCHFSFDYADDDEDMAKSQLEQLQTATIMSMWSAGQDPAGGNPVVSREEVRQMLADNVSYFDRSFLEADLTDKVQGTDTEQQDEDTE